jgi:aminocarboxymuconate-semialdehyde decarboxylase
MATQVSVRLQAMDEQGIDIQALSINPNWYKLDRDLAKQVCAIQNEKLAAACAANPDRFVAFASVALQHPDLAAEQLEEGVKRFGLREPASGATWRAGDQRPEVRSLLGKSRGAGVPVFIHPQGTGRPSSSTRVFRATAISAT